MPDPSVVSLVHLGCARNLVDSELILGRLAEEGLIVAGDPEQALACVRAAIDSLSALTYKLTETLYQALGGAEAAQGGGGGGAGGIGDILGQIFGQAKQGVGEGAGRIDDRFAALSSFFRFSAARMRTAQSRSLRAQVNTARAAPGSSVVSASSAV